MLTTKEEATPDPDRSGEKDVIESRDAPTVFQQENSDDSDEQEEQDETNPGYQIITQEDEDGEDQEDEDEAEPEVSRETELANLVRAAQADPENLTEATREMMDRARYSTSVIKL